MTASLSITCASVTIVQWPDDFVQAVRRDGERVIRTQRSENWCPGRGSSPGPPGLTRSHCESITQCGRFRRDQGTAGRGARGVQRYYPAVYCPSCSLSLSGL
ncbi:hypothetical protein E2C01_069604 [Portunus trituberculatus]|uniref:Uncharacterized protein n=1 Tax=Portunus trituberculatus TaxID=210409 RepID=A0A5B7HS01_PORTR|nr:hypothetical protein [Portunus trituberculatus]